MGLRIYRRIRLARGIHLNLSKSGASLSLGTPGATLNVGPAGIRSTLGVPGTGVSYVSTVPWSKVGPADASLPDDPLLRALRARAKAEHPDLPDDEPVRLTLVLPPASRTVPPAVVRPGDYKGGQWLPAVLLVLIAVGLIAR